MPGENIGLVIVTASIGFELFIGVFITWPFYRYSILKLSIISISFGLVLIGIYSGYVLIFSKENILDVLSLEISVGEIKTIGHRSFMPLHIFGYGSMVYGIMLLPFSIFMRHDPPKRDNLSG